MWRREKSAMLDETTRLESRLRTEDFGSIVTSTCLSLRIIERWLRDHSYAASRPQFHSDNGTSYVTVWRGPTRSVIVVQVNHTEADADEIAAASRLPGRQLCVTDRGGTGFRHFADSPAARNHLSPSDNRLLAPYLRKTH